MSFEQSKFGDGSAAGAGNVVQTVSNHYGPREVGQTAGRYNVDGAYKEVVIDLTVEMVENEAFPLVAPVLRAGSIVDKVFVYVTEAFSLGGSATVDIGTEGSETTNGVEITEANLESLGMIDVTSAVQGTWASGLAADTTVGIEFSGTVANADVGKARVVIRYAEV